MYLIAFATLVLSAADHWTTYLCLRNPVTGWDVSEANPISDWLFSGIGLVPGLLVDSAIERAFSPASPGLRISAASMTVMRRAGCCKTSAAQSPIRPPPIIAISVKAWRGIN